ncbi:hypothetical protein C1646_766235 [Rhizophagus diaphanus]|nr:hypothetical protein C1646_766235 [Rhizophagus diaphanus] [Rhizophagus sp. MUCL 43196]
MDICSWIVKQKVPIGSFRWIDLSNDAFLTTSPESTKGYVLEVDLSYPANLHDHHSTFIPLAPEMIRITKEQLSPYQQWLLERDTDLSLKYELVPTFFPKKNYIVHYRNLQCYLQHGLKLSKVHRLLEFDQSHIHSIINSDVANSVDDILIHVIDDLNYNIIKFTIAEFIELSTYKLYYDILYPYYGNKIELRLIDNDELLFEIATKDITNDLKVVSSKLDSEELPNIINKYPNDILIEFVGLNSNTYSILKLREDRNKCNYGIRRVEGLSKSDSRLQLYCHQEFVDSLFNSIKEYKNSLQ